MTTPTWDVLVVGAGPSGAATAHWLADAGHRVLVVDKKQFPREKTCGDGLTPRAVRQLHDMGLAEPLEQFLRFDGLRSIAHGVTLELPWPDHPDFPPYGYVVRRRDLDEMVAERAVKVGATLWSGAEAVAPLIEDGLVTGAAIKRDGTTEPVRAKYLVVADGANSRFGRAIGTVRDRTYPLGMAIRGYFTSPFHDEPWIESHLDLHDREGRNLPGYGWVFPVGDGTVNVGVGLLSTFAGLEVDQHELADGRVRRHGAAALGNLTGDVVRRAHRRDAAHRRVVVAERRAHLARRRRRRGFGESVQRRGHLRRVRDRPVRRECGVGRAHVGRRPRARRSTPSSSTRRTRCIGRWRGSSCAPSGTRR